ncbi:hypothetical protein PY310_21280 [Pseudarthrobacter sp. H3Y2-7]|uniref:hypothetical protein n=1 Tax=Pseudarthrobacter naphthalenicus TaxID=3031328 RepID=UPI0023AF8EBB|nr:hypothetical protein [Pseudarthrobacter sp. H3Y2-7]MDE8671085.1 hypothetical protein [Pseudarthrobacter sp. H3Y2-7]
MFEWVSQSFSQYSVIWILLSGFIGGLTGASTKFFFEDLLRPRLSAKRGLREVTNRYSIPLMRSADSLERRINNIVRNSDKNWYKDSEYYHLSTLFIFGEYLALVRIIERDLGYLPRESQRQGKLFTRRLNGIFRALSSFAYFRAVEHQENVDASQVPRLMLTAIGEKMLTPEGKVRDFTDFALTYTQDIQFRRWFFDLDRLIASALAGDPTSWDRLIAAALNLRILIWFIDPKCAIVDHRKVANLHMVKDSRVLEELRKELGMLASP